MYTTSLHQVDVYAFGVVMWEIVHGESWYSKLYHLYRTSKNGKQTLSAWLEAKEMTGIFSFWDCVLV